ncbi:MAG: hydrogenase maturation nickel metallochaperone HypA [FCB group bacterium]|nr:hydrogenase maturation nickel metallochaperone HypA [FCB group bacterium]
MHEMSIALSLCDLAAREAEKAQATKINEVEIEVGDLAGILIESLDFCFGIAAKSTIVNGAKLKIIRIPAKGTCLDCGSNFTVREMFARCPDCDSFKVRIDQGKDLRIRSINVD